MTSTQVPGGHPDGHPGGHQADVAGMSIDQSRAEPRTDRPKVAIVMSAWGSNWGERATAVRLVAGALSLKAEVVVVSLDDRSDPETAPPRRTFDGIFPIHSAAASPSHPRVSEVLQASLRRFEQRSSPEAAVLPEVASRGLLALDARPSAEAIGIISHLQPDVVVAAGVETLWMGESLPVGEDRPRVVVLPLLGTDTRASSVALAPLAEIADAVGAFSHSECQLLAESVGSRRRTVLHRLSLPFPVNRQASLSGLAGTASFGRYVLVISGWPDDDPAAGIAPVHDYLREFIGDISVAEVRHGRWLVSEHGRHFQVPWAANRMNLWRLMAGAVATIDVRPGGPIGREAIESMMFRTPVVVRAGTVAAEHAKEANGGLWYAAPGEMVDAARHLVENTGNRDRLAKSAREWAENEHADTQGLVQAVSTMVLG
ncbi:MAG: glycosyltransferase [Acidimicrobiales bacterium]